MLLLNVIQLNKHRTYTNDPTALLCNMLLDALVLPLNDPLYQHKLQLHIHYSSLAAHWPNHIIPTLVPPFPERLLSHLTDPRNNSLIYTFPRQYRNRPPPPPRLARPKTDRIHIPASL